MNQNMNQNINVLSWNVCWGCMSADVTSANDKTAYNLAIQCKNLRNNNNGQHVCLNNISRSIDYFNSNTPYDFIAIQEAKNWYDIFNGSPKLQTMGYIHHTIMTGVNKNTAVDLITFYDKNRYRPLAVKVGNIGKFDGRPY